MRAALLALAAVAAAVPGPARAEDQAEADGAPAARSVRISTAAPSDAAQPAPRPQAPGLPRWGLAFGAGFPEFATASVVFRPLAPVRLHAGPSWNYFGWGLQGGVSWVPWRFAIAPVLSLEAGRFFASDLSFVAGDDEGAMKPLLDDVSYSYATAAVGLEIGSQRGLSFLFRLGLSYVSIATHGTGTRAEAGGSSVSLTDPKLNATLPSLELGLQYWF
jgi:hypothetical protein